MEKIKDKRTLKSIEMLKEKCINLCNEAKNTSIEDLNEEIKTFSEKDQFLIYLFIIRCNKGKRSPNPDPIVSKMSSQAKDFSAKMAFKIAMSM